MAESNSHERFNERRKKCSPTMREVLDFLMKAAANAGRDVQSTEPELKGEGVKYWSGRGRFFVLHPKYQKHVQAWINHDRGDRAALIASLDAARLTFTRGDTDGPWVPITNMRDAVRFVPFIVRAYDEEPSTRH